IEVCELSASDVDCIQQTGQGLAGLCLNKQSRQVLWQEKPIAELSDEDHKKEYTLLVATYEVYPHMVSMAEILRVLTGSAPRDRRTLADMVKQTVHKVAHELNDILKANSIPFKLDNEYSEGYRLLRIG